MLIDILSDTHFDSHFAYLKPSEGIVESFWSQLKPKAETLIIAGDIGHYNEQNINILKSLLYLYYKHIVLVLGNHDYYIQTSYIKTFVDARLNLQYRTSQERVDEFRALCKDIKGIHLLEGDVVEIDGVKIGGSMGWYDGSYHKHNTHIVKQDGRHICNKRIDTQVLWERTLNDSLYIKPSMKYDDFLQSEKLKIKNALNQNPDVMVTHINPSIQPGQQHPLYWNDITSTFFCYDGREEEALFNGDYWIFGHSHFNEVFNCGKYELVSNCLGYGGGFSSSNGEIKNAKILTIKLESND